MQRAGGYAIVALVLLRLNMRDGDTSVLALKEGAPIDRLTL
jgi:hypothetical protein